MIYYNLFEKERISTKVISCRLQIWLFVLLLWGDQFLISSSSFHATSYCSHSIPLLYCYYEAMIGRLSYLGHHLVSCNYLRLLLQYIWCFITRVQSIIANWHRNETYLMYHQHLIIFVLYFIIRIIQFSLFFLLFLVCFFVCSLLFLFFLSFSFLYHLSHSLSVVSKSWNFHLEFLALKRKVTRKGCMVSRMGTMWAFKRTRLDTGLP